MTTSAGLANPYERAGTEFAAAWLKMREAWETPPSFEVFLHELRQLNLGRRRVSPTELADRLLDQRGLA